MVLPRIASARSHQTPVYSAPQAATVIPNVASREVEIPTLTARVYELFDPLRTPEKHIQTCVENQLLRCAGTAGFVKFEHIRVFQEQILAVPDEEGFTHKIRRLVNIDRKSLLLAALSKIKKESLSKELETCLTNTKDPERAQILLKLGANPNTCVKNKSVPELAIEKKHEALMTTWALSPGVNVSLSLGNKEWILTALARQPDFTEAMRLLILRGANLNAVTVGSMTPLMLAALNKRTEKLSVLLQAGAHLFMIDNFCKTAWDYADETGKNLITYALQKKFEAENSLYSLYTKPNPRRMRLNAAVVLKPISAEFKEALNLSGSGLRIYIMNFFQVLRGTPSGIKSLLMLLKNVESSNPELQSLPENPAEKIQFYDRMRNHLEHIALFLSDPTILESEKKSALMILAEAGDWCAARYMQDAITAHRILSQQIPNKNDEETAVLDILGRLRNEIFYGICGKFLDSQHSANTYNFLLSQLAIPLGLAQTNESYKNDPNLPKINTEKLIAEFRRCYTAETMIQAIREAIEKKEIKPAVVPSLLAQYRPRTGPYAHETKFMDLVLDEEWKVTNEGLFYLILAMGVLIPKEPKEHPWVLKYGLIVPTRPSLLETVAEQNRLLVMQKKADFDKQRALAGDNPSELQRLTLVAFKQEIIDLAQWLKQDNALLTMKEYYAAAISLQNVVMKNRESYLRVLTGIEFSAKIGRCLSQEQAERIVNAMDSCIEEDEVLKMLNPT